MQPGDCWKLFDVTSLVRKQATAPQPSHGAVLRFPENRGKERTEWSGYAFVSREALGEWESYRPALLVVDPEK